MLRLFLIKFKTCSGAGKLSGNSDSSGFLPIIESAPTGQTAIQCWHFIHFVSSSTGILFSSNFKAFPIQSFMHFPQ